MLHFSFPFFPPVLMKNVSVKGGGKGSCKEKVLQRPFVHVKMFHKIFNYKELLILVPLLVLSKLTIAC